MDDIDRELINLLCTKVGMLMEDHSALALTLSGLAVDKRRTAIKELASASTTIEKLTAAAQAIAE